jgi:hypothetical protein
LLRLFRLNIPVFKKKLYKLPKELTGTLICCGSQITEVQAEKTVLIGDTASTDGEAARSAGIKFIHFTPYEFDPQADAHVRPQIGDSKFSLNGLTDAVRNIRLKARS